MPEPLHDRAQTAHIASSGQPSIRSLTVPPPPGGTVVWRARALACCLTYRERSQVKNCPPTLLFTSLRPDDVRRAAWRWENRRKGKSMEAKQLVLSRTVNGYLGRIRVTVR